MSWPRQALALSAEISATPVMLETLRGYALLWAARDMSQATCEKTVALLHLILEHPASEQETKDRARQLYETILSERPADSPASAMRRHPHAALETFIQEILSRSPE